MIVVASVSCIYGLGSPEEYYNLHLSLRKGDIVDRDEIMKRLIDIQYTRNEMDFKRSTFRAKGDTLDIFPADQSEMALRVRFLAMKLKKCLNLIQLLEIC